jgi:hypothetical protein
MSIDYDNYDNADHNNNHAVPYACTRTNAGASADNNDYYNVPDNNDHNAHHDNNDYNVTNTNCGDNFANACNFKHSDAVADSNDGGAAFRRYFAGDRVQHSRLPIE